MWDMAGMYASLARILNHQQKNQGIVKPEDIHPAKYTAEKGNWKKSTNENFPLDATSIFYTFEAVSYTHLDVYKRQ